LLYKNGRGVSQDYVKAAEWFHKAADQGNSDAMSNIGWLYQYGLGVDKDSDVAAVWYRKAVALGNAQAQANLEHLLSGAPSISPPEILSTCSGQNSSSCITFPKPLFQPEPEFSKEAREAKYQGTCVLALVVGTDGVPSNIRIVKSLGKGLDDKAVEAVQKWRFTPGMKDGKPVPVALQIEVDFRLK
jgi:TonB family protein